MTGEIGLSEGDNNAACKQCLQHIVNISPFTLFIVNDVDNYLNLGNPSHSLKKRKEIEKNSVQKYIIKSDSAAATTT